MVKPTKSSLFKLATLLVIAVLAAFHQVLFNDFVNWDDDANVYANPTLRAGVSASGVRWALTAINVGCWIPVTHLSLLVDYELYGLKASGYHFTNLLLHIGNACLAFVVFHRWTGQPNRSLVAAALFALHPLRVESVAWVSERKDVLSTFFGLIALLAYDRYVARPGPRSYLLLVGSALLSLLAKPMLVTLPFLLVLLDYWPLQRMRVAGPATDRFREATPVSWTRLLIEKLPLLALSVIFSVVAIRSEQSDEGIRTLATIQLGERLANAAVSYARYLQMTVLPVGLAAYYPRLPENLAPWKVAASAILLIAICALALRRARGQPALFVGWFWFLGTLVPVIGLVASGGQALADRYTYFPSLGLSLAVTWGAADGMRALGWSSRVQVALATTILLIFAGGTVLQTLTWRDSLTLWSATLKVNDKNAQAHFKLGETLEKQGRLAASLVQYDRALAIETDNASYLCYRAMVLSKLDRLTESLVDMNRACELAPRSVDAHLGQGVVLVKLKRIEEALAVFHRACEIEPQSAAAHYKQGWALFQLGRNAEAEDQFRITLELDEARADTYNSARDQASVLERYFGASYNLAQVQVALGRVEDAVGNLNRAVAVAPSPAGYKMLGQLLMRLDRYAEAAQAFQAALQTGGADQDAAAGLRAAQSHLAAKVVVPR